MLNINEVIGLDITENELPGKFLATFHRFKKLDMTPIMEGLSPGEAQLLTVIECKEKEEKIRVSGIAERMNVSSPAVSRMLKKLEEQGLIERNIDKEDRRNTYVKTTESGDKLVEQIKYNLHDFAGSVLSQMKEEDYERAIAFLNELYDAAEEKLSKIRKEQQK